MSTGLHRTCACCEYAGKLEVPSINPTIYRAAVTSSYRLAPHKLHTLNTKFYHFNRCFSVHFDKYKTIFAKKMHCLLKHKMLQFVS